MKARARIGRRRSLVVTALLTTQIVACSSWRVEPVAPEQLLHERAPAELRVTRTDGSQLVLARPKVSGDSLTGLSNDAPRGVPLADIGTIATRHGDAGKSVLLGLGIVGGLFAIAAVALSGQTLGAGGY
jgi:hypothetical protein